MQILVLLTLVATVVVFVWIARAKRDRNIITDRATEQGGRVVRIKRKQKGGPFADTGRGWWSWRVEWEQNGQARVSWALTTRDGLKDWRE